MDVPSEKAIPILERTLKFMLNDIPKGALSQRAEIEKQELCKEIEALIGSSKTGTLRLQQTLDAKQRPRSETITSSESLENLKRKVNELGSKSAKELQEGAVMCGYLSKHKKKMMTQWKRRYCILKDYFLFYFKTETDPKEQGYIILPAYDLEVSEKDRAEYCFTLQPKEKNYSSYSFVAETKEDFEKWQNHISNIVSTYLSKSEMELLTTANQNMGDKDKDDYSDSSSVRSLPISSGVVEDDIYEVIPNASNQLSVVPPPVVRQPSPALPQPPPDFLQSESPVPIEESLYESIPAQMMPEPEAGTLFSAENIYLGTHNCQADDANELSFSRGDVIYIMEMVDSNWGLGYSQDKVGLVPLNHVTRAY